MALFLGLIQLSLGQHDWEMLTVAVTITARRVSWRQVASMSVRTVNALFNWADGKVYDMGALVLNHDRDTVKGT